MEHITLIEEANSNPYQRNVQYEILKWRELLRKEGYLITPERECDHLSLSGKKLDSELVNFDILCKENRKTYHNNIRSGHDIGKGSKLTPVFTTPQSRSTFHDVTKKTKTEISGIINKAIEEISALGRNEEARNLLSIWNNIDGRGTKDEYLAVYKEVVIALEDATQRNDIGKRNK